MADSMSANPGAEPTTPYMGGSSAAPEASAETGKAIVKDYAPDVSSSDTAARKGK